MRYAGLIKNDFSAAPGVSVSFFVQGCPHHCPGCQNPETWGFDGGKEFTPEILDDIIDALNANDVERSFCVLGGEPLCPDNEFLTNLVVKTVREKVPNVKIYVWTGYEYEKIAKDTSSHMRMILSNIDYIIDGPYIEAERDVTLPMRGSRNQRIIPIDRTQFL